MSTTMTRNPITATGLFSADSHVIEPPDLWRDVLPENFWGSTASTVTPGGGTDPLRRCDEMAQDGVAAEVLYATLGLRVLGVQDPAAQEAACRVYNDWLAQYCSTAPDRLLGVGLIAAYDAQRAVAEIERCAGLGFKGIMMWQVPHPDLPFRSHHYDPIWAAAVRLNLPVSLHILSGYEYAVSKVASSPAPSAAGEADAAADFRQVDRLQRTVNLKLFAALDSTLELVVGGVFERFPALKVVIVENEIGWLPFAVTQWDYFCLKKNTSGGAEQAASGLSKLPSAYVGENIYATFFRDVLSANILQSWGSDTFMWSNDFPHNNSTWPNSREFIEHQLAGVPDEILVKVLRTNAERLYGQVPER